MLLKKIMLDSGKEDHFVFLDPTQIRVVQVQLPTENSLIQVQGEYSVGVVRVFMNGMDRPFQFTRKTSGEVHELVSQLVENVE